MVQARPSPATFAIGTRAYTSQMHRCANPSLSRGIACAIHGYPQLANKHVPHLLVEPLTAPLPEAVASILVSPILSILLLIVGVFVVFALLRFVFRLTMRVVGCVVTLLILAGIAAILFFFFF